MTDAAIGVREYGKRAIEERWYRCAILDEHVPESETTIPSPPHPQAGLRVCFRCLDEPDYDMNRRQAPPTQPADELGP